MGKAFVAKLAKEGARDPEALAAWIGRKKHGGKAFSKLATSGRKKNETAKPASGPEHAQGHAPSRPVAQTASQSPSPTGRAGAREESSAPATTPNSTSKPVAEMRAAIEQALANGWERVPGAPGEVKIRRSETHQTPSNIPARWWDHPTYESHEFISVRAINGKISAFHEESPAPWVGGRGTRKVSAKKAREILNP